MEETRFYNLYVKPEAIERAALPEELKPRDKTKPLCVGMLWGTKASVLRTAMFTTGVAENDLIAQAV